jgi:hypothetical protein
VWKFRSGDWKKIRLDVPRGDAASGQPHAGPPAPS